ncbi:DeoR/GlpR transcriptional regulator [Leucobacter sp. CSA1]|uniref:Lactose phosphotransferase system repressor n=1 Tax=Leucobacter chromiisoli TaxID=2796471 RepID=A0A934UUE7_9MICO|nr:DeoR/GlpR family DNA-binding transcription regulator [Leucobacter chromiisoli]MBK0419404.1 DeoR/GlpR transcriptional regulator [Leucobacter chromiisoli]
MDRESESLRHGGAERRRILILERLYRVGHVSVRGLSDEFAVTDMTIRRDLRRLADEGELELVHGGARLVAGRQGPIDFAGRRQSNPAAKQRVAEAAKRIVPLKSVLGVDAGTTTHACVLEIAAEFTGCIVTHSIPVLASMLERPESRVIGVGGDLLHENQAMVGPDSIAALRDLRIDVLLLGASAVDGDGIYVHGSVELATKRALIDASEEVVLVVDSSKAQASGAVRVCDLRRISTIVTDAPWEAGLAAVIEAQGVEFVLPR